MSWTAARVRAALGLPPGPSAQFREISTDTRTLHAGALFVALSGERFDGHDHLATARDRGATAAIVRRGTPPVERLELLEVEDPLRAYGELAHDARRMIPGPVVAITGSNGKTSTKEMLAAVLRTRYAVHATAANLNNLVGVPQTILAAPPHTESLVIEAGANQPGEIARAREIIEPDIAIITNVSESHLEGFGQVARVLTEKLALVDGVRLGIVGTQPPALAVEARKRAQRVLTGGLSEADVMPEAVLPDDAGRPRLLVDGVQLQLPLVGHHQAGNAMLAWALVRELGLDPAACAAALANLVIPGGRGQLIQSGRFTILHDAYNANPASFRAAIAVAREMRRGRRLVFVAGTMRELGPDSARLHQDIARELADLDPDLLGVVGDFVPAMADVAGRLGDRLLAAPDPVELGPVLAAKLHGNEVIVLKASRGVQLERILPHLGVADAAAAH